MSETENFIDMLLPCSTCVVNAICKDNSSKSYKINKSSYCLVLPDWNTEEKSFEKGVFECWFNLGKNIEKLINPERLQLSTEYYNLCMQLADVLLFMVNSISWRDGKTYRCDISDIKYKLEKIIKGLPNE